MADERSRTPVSRSCSPAATALHVALLLLLSGGFESLFLYHGLNRIDEGLALYPATRLLAGDVLYRDAFFLFPPGHLLPALFGAWLAPPGVVAARWIYAAFSTALCVSLYFLGRRLMPAPFALLGAALLAVAAPDTHLWHGLFGYRYFVFATLALIAFGRRLDSGDSRWMLAAGALAGLALCFRLTPAVAVLGGLLVGGLAADPRPRRWLPELGLVGLGLAAVAGPVIVWLVAQVGAETLWREAVVRPLAMSARQSLPIPPLSLPPSWTRSAVESLLLALQFRLYPLLYAAYLVPLVWRGAGALRRGAPHPNPLLLATVVTGAVFFLRSLARADRAHLDTTLPLTCLLLAHALFIALRMLGARRPFARLRPGWRGRTGAATAAGLVAFAAWAWVQSTDVYLPLERRGRFSFAALDGRVANRLESWAQTVDARARLIAELARTPGTVLDMTGSPLFHVLGGRPGPGGPDVIMPGTFLSEEEERRFLTRLESAPPAVVIWPHTPFDRMESRSVLVTAPLISQWVLAHYRPLAIENWNVFPLLVRADRIEDGRYAP